MVSSSIILSQQHSKDNKNGRGPKQVADHMLNLLTSAQYVVLEAWTTGRI